MPNPVKVLLLASDPYVEEGGPLRLDLEARAVRRAIRRARHRRTLRLATEWAVTIEEFQHLLVDHQPGIVHFAGHGDRSKGIFLTDQLGDEQSVDRESLRELFQVLRRFVRVVVLNACETFSTATALSTVIDYTVGMKKEISDAAAAAFAEEFYGALASGMTVQDAFNLGRNRLRMQHRAEYRIPQFLVREGVDPDGYVTPETKPVNGARPARRTRERSEDTRVRDAVTFTAACFPGLAPNEFGDVVKTLLAVGSGTAAEAALRTWSEDADRLLAQCNAAIADVGGPQRMREALARDHPVRFDRGFRAVHEAGFLFGGSDTLAGALVRLSAEVAARHPEAYGGEWLLGLLARERRPGEATSPHAIARFARLLRAFYAEKPLARAADAALDGLLRERSFTDALELVQRLRGAPAFDAHRWLYRVVGRGDERTVAAVHGLLTHELLSAGLDVFPVLESLARWLPSRSRVPATLTAPQEMALKLLPEYAAAMLEARSTGGDYPLLAIPRDSLPRSAALLASWLFHPCMPAVCGPGRKGVEEMHNLVAGLVAGWATGVLADGAAEARKPSEIATADEVLTALLSAIAAETADVPGSATRKALEAYWEGMKKYYVQMAGLLSWSERAQRRELLRRRDLLQALLDRFRQLLTA